MQHHAQTRPWFAGAALAALAVAGGAHAQAPADRANAHPTLQTVVVTGTRAFNRTVADSLSPIDVLTAHDLTTTGATSLAGALRVLLPSFNFPRPSVTGAADATPSAELRGLSPDETLVLINGKRQHPTASINVGPSIGRGSSPVDLSAIPVNAIARVEVLRDGAAAQYGSDAIAGVINVILKGGAGHGAVNAGFGQHDHREGEQGDTWQGGADGGIALGQRGWLHLSANYLDQQPTNHAGWDYRYPSDPTYGRHVIRYGLPDEQQHQAALNGEYRLGANATLYAFGVFNRRTVETTGTFHSLSDYQAIGPAAVARYPAGFLPFSHYRLQDDTEVLGLRGEWLGWHYDLSATDGGNHTKQSISSTFNDALGAASPTAFYLGTLVLRQTNADADFSRDFDVGVAGPVTVAWGLAWRRDRFTIKPGEPDSYFGTGAEESPGTRPADAGSHSRRNLAEYVDLETDASQRLSGALAARHEHYSDFGNTTSWELSGRYALTPLLALRGTVSTGFRAPSLQQEFFSNTDIEFVNTGPATAPFIIGTFPVSNPAAVALGAQPLKPEKSHNYSVGLVFTPRVGPYVTLDLYQVNVDDRIILSGDLVGPAVEAYLQSVGILGVTGGRFFTNAVDTHTYGADLVGTWNIALADAQLDLTGGANYNRTELRSVRPNPPQLGLAGLTLPVIDRDEQGRITVGMPRSKSFLAATWQRGAWTLRAQATRYGSWETLGDDPSGDQTFGARVLLDLAASYTLRNWTFTVGGNNVANVYPEQNDAANAFAGNIQYPWSSPFGFSGSYWYANVDYRW